MITSLLRDKKIENVAIAIGISIVLLSRGKTKCKKDMIDKLNEKHILDVDLTRDVLSRLERHKELAFTYTPEHGLILLEDIVTEDIDDACEDYADLIKDTVVFVSKII